MLGLVRKAKNSTSRCIFSDMTIIVMVSNFQRKSKDSGADLCICTNVAAAIRHVSPLFHGEAVQLMENGKLKLFVLRQRLNMLLLDRTTSRSQDPSLPALEMMEKASSHSLPNQMSCLSFLFSTLNSHQSARTCSE